MKTDRELLELAAKAAGAKWTDYSDKTADHWIIKRDGFWSEWKPLTDDGDAFRLAVKLKMRVDVSSVHTEVSWVDESLSETHRVEQWSYGETPEKFTRRAIVLCAAEIGRTMP